MNRIVYILILIVTVVACVEKQEEERLDDVLLASVFEKNLYYSDILPMLQTEVSAEDSIQYSRALIEKWVRDAILMREAELNIPEDLDIQKMVDDYRSSLILMTYKQNLVHSELDTLVTQSQLEGYYEEQKSQYKLSEAVLKLELIKISKDQANIKEVDKLWEDKRFEEINTMENEVFEFILKPENGWFTWVDIKALLPVSFWSINDIKGGNPRNKSTDKYKYFIKVEDFVDKNGISPLSYIEDQVKKVILHKRQTEVLDNLIEELYDNYSNNNNVKVNI